jgi:peptidoglycan/LPS O-acetylase OafA/YrhL
MDRLDPKQRFLALDGWRGICAVLVALYHIPIKCGMLGLGFFNHAGLFVDFFFVLSGFVIAHAYGARVAGDELGLTGFAIGRFGRLWPLHAAVFAVFLFVNLVRLTLFNWYGTANDPSATGLNLLLNAVREMTLLQAAVPPPPGVLTNGPAWSISTEFWAYILFALVAIRFQKNALRVKAAIVAVSLFILCPFVNDGADPLGWLTFFRCFYGFFLGQILFSVFASSASARWQSSWSLGAATGIEISIVVAVVIFVSVANTRDYGFAAPALFACVVYAFAAEAGLVSRLLGTRPFRKLGRYSYSIYMIHALFIVAVRGALHIVEKLAHVHLIQPPLTNGPGDTSFDIYFGGNWLMLGFAMLILAAIVETSGWTYRFIERPGQALFNRLAAKSTALRVATPI